MGVAAGTKYVIFTDSAGEVRWHRLAGNNRVIETSGEGYTRWTSARNAVLKFAPDADVFVMVSFAGKHHYVPLDVWEQVHGGKP